MTPSSQPRYHIQQLTLSEDSTIIDLFSPYAGLPWSMLLDSGDSQHPDGRFDLFVAQPLVTIESRGSVTTVKLGDNKIKNYHQQNPLDVVNKYLESYLPKIPLPQLNSGALAPFASGAVGYFGYDLGRQFEVLPAPPKPLYQSPDMAIGIYAWCVLRDNSDGQTYLISRSDCPTPSARELVDKLTNDASGQAESFQLIGDWQSNMSEEQYLDNIAAIHEYLCAGDCYQVNLAQRFNAGFTGDSWHAYRALREANRAPFSAFLRFQHNAIASISPERFLQVKNNQVQTKPIKGTRPRMEDSDADHAQMEALLASEKDQAENLMIVDLLRNDLSRACQAGSIKVPELFVIESFRAVHHLVSTVTGTLQPNMSGLDLLGGAFPGGSITGAPKIRAMEIIEQLEPDRRNIYCGSIGYLDCSGNMDTNICIRTLLFESNIVYCWAGGGIVLDSQAKSEYQESYDKVAKILPVLEAL